MALDAARGRRRSVAEAGTPPRTSGASSTFMRAVQGACLLTEVAAEGRDSDKAAATALFVRLHVTPGHMPEDDLEWAGLVEGTLAGEVRHRMAEQRLRRGAAGEEAHRVAHRGHGLVVGEALHPAGHGRHRHVGRRDEAQREDEEREALRRLRAARHETQGDEEPDEGEAVEDGQAERRQHVGRRAADAEADGEADRRHDDHAPGHQRRVGADPAR